MLKTVSSISNAIGALNYKGTWNASTNSPALASGVGTKGDYYVVSVAGSTTLDGISNWGVGDWATFNGSVWQRVEGGADGDFVNMTASGKVLVGTTSDNGSVSNTALLVGGIHRTASGTVASAPTGVVQDLATLPSASYSTYIVTTSSPAADPVGYQGVHLLKIAGATAQLVSLSTAGSMSVSMSGLTLRCSQSSGITLDINWTIIRVA
jgi:hypothetical protein